MPQDFAELRTDYDSDGLDVSDIPADPTQLIARWLDEALAAKLYEPHAMTVSTASKDGAPSSRILLLRGLDARGLVFYTNYESRKGTDLAENARAAANLFWPSMHRQVRVEGSVSKVSAEESDAYFASRPRGSQEGAWASTQSKTLANRDELEAEARSIAERFEGGDVPRPPHWGGYRLAAERIEFWQGRPSRLHDRILAELRTDGTYALSRLAP